MLRLLSLAIVAAFLTTACGDDDMVAVTEDGVVGTWNVESITQETSTTSTVASVSASITSTGTTTASDASIVFAADGTYANQGSYDIRTTITGAPAQIPPTEQTINIDGSGGDWSLNGTTLSFSGATVGSGLQDASIILTTSQAEITTFTAGERLEFVTKVDTVINQGGGTVALSGEVTTVLTQ